MSHAIDQFMWRWQPHFRISVQSDIERALELVDAHLDPRVFLVGFADAPDRVRHPVCIEPETGPLSPRDMDGVEVRAGEIFDADPERRIIHSDPGVHDSRQRWLQRRARALALAEVVEGSGRFPGKRVIASTAGHVGAYEVHTCVALDKGPLDALPRLEGEDINRFPAPSSFVGHVVQRVLREADIALGGQDPGMDAIRPSAEDLVIGAADEFAAGCSYRTRNFRSPWFLRDMNRITQRRYEGGGAAGRLILARPDHPAIDVLAVLERPVSLRATRAVRKLLEMTDDDVGLIVHEHGVIGLGRATDNVDDIFSIAVTGHATWELAMGPMGLLRMTYGAPTLPTPIFDAERLVDVLERVFEDAAPEKLLPLVSAAASARHGTTLVISAEAESEAQRLAGQATLVEPAELSPALLAHFSRIDGAVLIDPYGVCVAIGVILDGRAEGEGDPARGARFNSALRYQRSLPAATVAVVVSEDGDVTHVPDLMPRVRRQDVLDAVTLLEEAARREERGEFSEAYDAVEQLAFYLSEAQCERVNALARAEHDMALASGGLAIIRPTLKPNPEMNNSYFID